MVDLDAFLDADKSMIIAPAGYGKTHAIIEVLSIYKEPKKVLVLTHTHAGIASIREKARKNHVEPATYTLDTISSFALFLTNTFIADKDRIPQPEDDNYFHFAVSTAINLLKARPIKDYLSSTYSHLIVDEYQDCTLLQHEFILRLSDIMKAHLLGDPLQGIFDFNDTLVDMGSVQHMSGFIDSRQSLSEPWRWRNKNEQLGSDLDSIRNSILGQNQQICITNYQSVLFQPCNEENEIYKVNTDAYRFFSWFINNKNPDSLLVIVPEKQSAKYFASRFQKQFGIKELEAFDDNWFYSYSKLIDSNNENNTPIIMRALLSEIMPQNVVNKWINNKNAIINKRFLEDGEVEFYNDLCRIYSKIDKSPTWFLSVIQLFKKRYSRVCKTEKTNAIIGALKIAIEESITVYEGMKRNRDKARRVGRRVQGRYVGTTLLTKGLEFDTVIVLNPNKLKNKKHLYVAITRATENLIIFSTSNTINIIQ